jgi:cytochrome bd-type quinol oxidase subunit 2
MIKHSSSMHTPLDAPPEGTDADGVGAPSTAHGSTIGSIPIAGAVTVLAVGLMAWDHLWGNERGSDDSFPVDPAAFFVALALIVVTALVVFGFTVPRAARNPGSVHRAALIHSGVALVLALPALWLGFPAVVAAGGIVLGIQALAGPHRRLAVVAIVAGLFLIFFAILATAFPSPDAD